MQVAGIADDDLENNRYDIVTDLEETTNRRTQIMIEQTKSVRVVLRTHFFVLFLLFLLACFFCYFL